MGHGRCDYGAEPSVLPVGVVRSCSTPAFNVGRGVSVCTGNRPPVAEKPVSARRVRKWRTRCARRSRNVSPHSWLTANAYSAAWITAHRRGATVDACFALSREAVHHDLTAGEHCHWYAEALGKGATHENIRPADVAPTQRPSAPFAIGRLRPRCMTKDSQRLCVIQNELTTVGASTL